MMFAGLLALLVALHNDRLAGRPIQLPPDASTSRDAFPGVRINAAAGSVEFDATISPMLVKDDRAPLFFLEVLCCAPNTREHESFLITTVRPSHIHAALLAAGLRPGAPGRWTVKDRALVPHPPSGDRLTVRIAYADRDGRAITADPLDWTISARDKSPFLARESKLTAPGAAPPSWLFTGSMFVKRPQPLDPSAPPREMYDADGSGTVIGLTTFGSEVIGWSRLISPDAGIDDPEWVADLSRTPPAETKVRVVLRKAD